MYYILLAIVFPIISGVYLLVRSEMKSRKRLLAVVTAMLCVTAVFEVFQSSMQSSPSCEILSVYFIHLEAVLILKLCKLLTFSSR